MTPEQYADAVIVGLAPLLRSREDREAVRFTIVNTVREAVVAERQACLQVVNDLTPDDPTDSRYRGAKEACDRIKAAILART